ncbi:bacteriorhodopsin [Amnibacterium kyonggiense]
MPDEVIQPWTVPLSAPEHDLILFGMVAAGLTLLATLVRVRFTSGEANGPFRVASLTASAVVAIAFVSYLTLIAAFALGYRATADGTFQPTVLARYAWELRYMDWIVTVPLLVIELVTVSAITRQRSTWVRGIGMVAAALMIGFGFLGCFVIEGGLDRTTFTLFGVLGAVCFALLYVLFVTTMRASLPRLPEAARQPYRAAIVLLLITWLIYPVVYGYGSIGAGGVAVVIGQLALCTADLLAKVGFGTLVHRTSVLRSRHEEDLDPSSPARPRTPTSDSMYVSDTRTLDFDE